jgi:hypothetical protein
MRDGHEVYTDSIYATSEGAYSVRGSAIDV